MFTIYVYVLDAWLCYFRGEFRPVFQKGRSARIAQNRQLFREANQDNGRSDNHARLPD